MRGVVRWFDVRRGYGFIIPDEGDPDVFLHRRIVRAAGLRRLEPGQVVEYEAQETPQGRKATRIVLVIPS